MSEKMHRDPDEPRRLGNLAERFCRELRTGQAPSIEEYAAQVPDLADEIREVFPALEFLERTGGRYAESLEGTLAERVSRQYGADADPCVTLQGFEEEQAVCSPEIVGRLAERGETFGRYQLKGEIARGGQGAVMHVWDEDLRRNLAMKVVLGKGDAEAGELPPVDSRTLGRFLEEAQVTGQLDHPGIVPVHELGLDSQSRVYFTMKLVKGRDLKAIFDLVRDEREGWNQPRALNVMLKVCEAMAYAHSKGVIHRDLKPSNVMVGRYGEVYVMDWGLARILDREDEKDLRIMPAMTTSDLRSERRDVADETPDSPLLTMDGDVVGTPAYMSPEQAAGRLKAMGPHSDVYSAGAMLYHLLAGQMPYVRPGMAATNYSIWHRVQEGPPPPLRELASSVPSELEAICEKAMARGTGARYADMQELAEDLRAFLEHRVVEAYETGALAELRKWVTRNRGLAVASAAAVLALLGGLATSSSLYAKAREKAREASENAGHARSNEERMRKERDRADLNAIEAKKQADLAQAEADRATREEATTERVLEFLTGMFEQQGPSEARGATITVKEVLDRNAAKIEGELGDEPEIKSRLLHSMGNLYHSLGLLQEAEPLLMGALSSRRSALGEDHPDTLASLNNLAELYHDQGRYAQAEPLLVQALETQRALVGEDHPDTLAFLNNLAALYRSQGRYAEAEPLYVDALEKHRTTLGEDHPDTLTLLNNLAMLYSSQKRYAEAEPFHVQAHDKHCVVLGEDHPDTLALLINLALLYYHQGKYEKAEPLLIQALEKCRTVLGETHPITLSALSSLAVLHLRQGRYQEAEPLLVQAIDERRAVLGGEHPDILVSMNNLGWLYEALGRYAEAEPLLVEALEKQRAVLGETHPDAMGTLNNLNRLYRNWLSSRREALGESHPDTLTTQNHLGVALWSQGKYEEAELLLLECLEKRTEVLGEDHHDTLASLYHVARLHESLQRWKKAELAAGMLLELTPKDAEEYAEREQLLERILEAGGRGQ